MKVPITDIMLVLFRVQKNTSGIYIFFRVKKPTGRIYFFLGS